MKNAIMTSLTFQDNNAENAMNLYIDTFKNSEIISVKRWGNELPDMEGKIMQAVFELDGNRFMCSDSPAIHEWNFSPAVSNFIECESLEEIERIFAKLSKNGLVRMDLKDDHGFSTKFAWIDDCYGVSWQLNLQ